MNIGKAIKHSINIIPTSNYGFFVRIGCGEFVFESKETLKEALSEFLDHPRDIEDDYNRSLKIPVLNTETDEVQDRGTTQPVANHDQREDNH